VTNVIRGPWAGRPDEVEHTCGRVPGELELGEPTCRGSVLLPVDTFDAEDHQGA
jgi:hypothetical protein